MVAIILIQGLLLILFNTIIGYFLNNNQVSIVTNRIIEFFIYFFLIPTNIILFSKTSNLKDFLPKKYLIFINKNKILLIIQFFILCLFYLAFYNIVYYFHLNILFIPALLFVFYLMFNIVLQILFKFVKE